MLEILSDDEDFDGGLVFKGRKAARVPIPPAASPQGVDLKYVRLLKGAFSLLELIHVPREQNARADLLAKLASSGKGGRQRTVIQETLKPPRKFIEDNRVDVLHISTARGRPRSHHSLTQDTVKTPHISTYADTP